MFEFICTVPVVSALFAICQPAPPLATGYVEGEYVMIAPVVSAQIDAVQVRRGDRVREGDVLTLLESRDAEIALAQAHAAVAQAESQQENLTHGRRDEEIAVIEASLATARVQVREAEREHARLNELFERNIVPQAQLDQAETALEMSRAKVGEIEANLAVARLPAREDEIRAAEAAVEVARTAVTAAEWRLSKRVLEAPAGGIVFDVLRREGEIAGPQAPVLSILPDGAIKLRLYLPEPALGLVSLGTGIEVECDGCPDGITAEVSYISDQPEFTPPVIYSLENRQKLVYLIEARPVPNGYDLTPGQIVSVDLSDALQ